MFAFTALWYPIFLNYGSFTGKIAVCQWGKYPLINLDPSLQLGSEVLVYWLVYSTCVESARLDGVSIASLGSGTATDVTVAVDEKCLTSDSSTDRRSRSASCSRSLRLCSASSLIHTPQSAVNHHWCSASSLIHTPQSAVNHHWCSASYLIHTPQSAVNHHWCFVLQWWVIEN